MPAGAPHGRVGQAVLAGCGQQRGDVVWPDAVPLLMVVGLFLAGQAFDAGFLSPSIVGSKIGLHPVWLIFALFVFSYLFGFVGVLVAVPVAAAIGVLVRFALKVYLGSALYNGTPGAAVKPQGDTPNS